MTTVPAVEPQHLMEPVLVKGAVARGSRLRFGTEITGIGGKEFGLAIATAVIGPGQEYEDPYGDWARLREIGDPGALLVRPDNHVAFFARG
ncbi:hypothetical protein AQJ58_09370 [Streptomyces sp. DSM 15324]|nr:hypothetical protein AQJ58_09370 [Streptomyces sp. DSM 15324]